MGTPDPVEFSPALPRWSLRALLLALMMTGLLYLLIPLTQRFSRHPQPDLDVRRIETVELPPPLKPPPPPPEELPEIAERITELPEPALNQPAENLSPLQLPVDLQPSFSGLQGVTANSFQVSGESLSGNLAGGVFEVADLDVPPRVVVQVSPVYPPRARMRKIEGYVTVEWIVTLEGTLRDIQVIDAKPGDIFESAVLRAMRGWRVEPGMKGGQPVETRMRQRIDFNLD